QALLQNPQSRPQAPLCPAAVLVGLVHRKDGLHILFTKRADNLEHHPGQICFPGGHIEATDKTPTAAALRETQEEIGLSSDHIQTLGRLDTYITRTGFSITPIVALISPPFELVPDPAEVADVFEVPLAFFMETNNHLRHEREMHGTTRSFYAMSYGDHYIWGATAGMLINLYQRLQKAYIDETLPT
ncbi:MAG: CoA pyrophosphatase, partial [Magnetovibrio sp.]|nr:CoA pyrophosphatase [Magnetovibrio sp.]